MLIDTIVSDMDDTLLNDDCQLSAYTVDVLRRCTERGIRVILASGRAMDSMLPHLKRLNTGCPAIGCNGAQLINTDLTLMRCLYFDAATARELCAFMEENGFYVQVYDNTYFYYATECEPSKQYKKSSGMEGRAVGDLQTGVVEHDVHGHIQRVDLAEHGFHGSKIVQLGGHGMSGNAQRLHLGLDLLSAFQRAAVQDQVAALLSHEDGGQIADAAACAGDQRPLAFHIDHGDSLLALLDILVHPQATDEWVR